MSRDTQITVESDGETHTLYETCGHSDCNEKVLKALGVGRERFTDTDAFTVVDPEEGTEYTIKVESADEQDACTWCFGCGDFLEHGLSCDCKERGYDPEQDREPLEPMVDVTGRLELRPFKDGGVQ